MIAIPNMEKPKSCYNHCFEGFIADKDIGCPLNDYIESHQYKSRIHPDCPLIEIDEPKAGRWIDTNMTCCGAKVYKCSVCDNEIDEMPTEMGEPIWNYCPNCGAKMEG